MARWLKNLAFKDYKAISFRNLTPLQAAEADLAHLRNRIRFVELELKSLKQREAECATNVFNLRERASA